MRHRSAIIRDPKTERCRTLREARENAALEALEHAKMEAGVKAFVEGSNKRDVEKYLVEEARKRQEQIRLERDARMKAQELKVCAVAITTALLSVIVAGAVVLTRH